MQNLYARLPFLLTFFFLVNGCITVNVNFPEAAVQQASDNYVEQLYRLREESQKQQSPSAEPKSGQGAQNSQQNNPWSLFIPQAWAVEFRVQSELISEIQRREVQRLDQVDRFKREGFIGENNRGLLEMRGEPKALQKRRMESLIKDENQDRNRLYDEILRVNGMDSRQRVTVTDKFANSFQAKSPKGTWVQNPQGQWSRK